MKGTGCEVAAKSILVVDDEPAVANTLGLLLMINKHKVEVVTDVGKALAVYDGGRYDLVITDFMMAGMDGLELARLIKQRAPEQRILMVTGYAQAVSEDEKRQMCIDGLLGKPFTQQQLNEAVRRVLDF